MARSPGPLRILDEWGPNFASATVINDRGQIGGVLEKKGHEEPTDPSRKKAQSPRLRTTASVAPIR
jgi:hypothetical protein